MNASAPNSFIIKKAILCLLCTASCLIIGGCMSGDSDLPWNEPQGWEGTPFVPGMNGM